MPVDCTTSLQHSAQRRQIVRIRLHPVLSLTQFHFDPTTTCTTCMSRVYPQVRELLAKLYFNQISRSMSFLAIVPQQRMVMDYRCSHLLLGGKFRMEACVQSCWKTLNLWSAHKNIYCRIFLLCGNKRLWIAFTRCLMT